MSDVAPAPGRLVRSFGERPPAIVWAADAAGELIFVDRAWTDLTGQSAAEALAGGRAQRVHPDDRDATLAAWRDGIASGATFAHAFRVRARDGSYRRHLERAAPARDASGAIERWYGTTVDVDDRQSAGEARDLFAALAAHSPDFIGIAGPDGKIVYGNDAGRRLFSLGPDADLTGGSLFELFAPVERERVEREVKPALARGESWSGEARFRRDPAGASGARLAATLPVDAHLFALRGTDDDVLALGIVAIDRTARERVERRLATLVDASKILSATLDSARTIDSAVRFVADRFASYSLLDIVDEERGEVLRLAVAHSDPARQPLVDELRRYRPPASFTRSHPVSRAIADGTPTLESIDAAWIRGAAISAGHAAAMDALDMRMLLVVPVIGASRTIGALTCALDAHDDRERFDDGDVAFAAELGRRIGLAIENARLFERERRIAVTMQAASLPRSLPAGAGLELDAEYRPGSSEATIGGDWYDAFVLDDGRIVMTVGDVIGNGLRAAVTMAKLRQTLRGAAMMRPIPSEMLDVADRTLRLENDAEFATALAAVYDPSRGTLEYAVAGHPPPMLVRPGSAGGDAPVVEPLAHEGTMLGLRRPGESETMSIPFPLGTTIVFYTDGLIEMTRDYDAGEASLREALVRPEIRRAPRPALAIVERILTDHAALDDLAVMTATAVARPHA